MRKNSTSIFRLAAGVLGLLAAADAANAQFFTANKGDLLLGFRKTSSGTYELVVNIGNVTNLLALSQGTTVNVNNFTAAQLSAAFPTYGNLQWSVFSAFSGSSAWAGFPASTIWSTVARSTTNVQSQPPVRASVSSQQAAKTRVYGVGTGGTTISTGLGTTNSNNNSVLIREPVGDGSSLSIYIGDPSVSTLGDFQGYWYNVENVTPASFAAPQRSDLYQSCPDGTTDPTTHETTGNAYYIGYFQFNTNGTMTFTRASATFIPPAPTLAIQRSGGTSTISFGTASGAAYTLYYTNASAVAQPVSTWPALPGSIVGDGLTHSFTDTTSAPDRVYRVGAQ
jgi:hypothetical protein